MRIVRVFFWFVLGLCLWSGFQALAQTVTGSMTGVVTDASGSVIMGAKVEAQNLATGVKNTGFTNDAGIYYMQYLRIGAYKLTVSAPGFNTQNYGPFNLEIDQKVKIDAKLKIGEATEVVTVSDTLAPILNTESATVGTTISSNTISNIPLDGQNFISLVGFLPGAVNTQPASASGTNGTERDTGGDSVPSINGNRQQSNNFILDGVEINETMNNLVGYNPNPDALDQVRVITTNAGAEFGNANGGTVIAVTKGGTNKFHGSVNGYLKNDKLDANTWANNYAGSAKSKYTQTIFNGTFGGPIKKDKLFFFVDYEGMRYHTGGEGTASVAPQTWRDGDFSNLGTQLYDPSNGFAAYTNNQITVANPAAVYLFAHPEYYPLPNKTPSSGLTQNNYKGNYKQYNLNDQGDVRIDWKIRDNDTVTGRFSHGHAHDGQPKAVLDIDFPGEDDYPYTGGVVSWAHIFSNALVNEFRAGVSRSVYNEGSTSDPTGNFNLKGNSILGIPGTQTQPGFSYMSFGDGAVDAFGSLGYIVDMIDNNFIYDDSLSWQKGHHLFKVGAQLVRYQQNYMFPGNDGALGEFYYDGSYSGSLGSTGSSVADFALDRAEFEGVGASYGYVGQRQWRDGFFVQDDWKVTPKLTLNLGMRWEFFQPIYEVNNKELNVNPTTMALEYAGKDGNSRALYNATYTNYEPRIGFAYQALPRFVVRGGYGITNFMEGTGSALRLTQNYPYNYSYEATASTPSATSDGNPYSVTNGFTSTASSSAATTYYAWDKNLKPSLTQQFNLTLEYELDNDSSLSVAYVGELGQHLVDAKYANQWKTIGDATTAPYAALVGSTGVVKVTEAEAVMNYHALQASYRHRASKGLEYTLNYTYGKTMSNNPGFYGSLGTNGASAYWQNAYDPHADYGPAYFDVRHNLSGTGVYELPLGKGKALLANAGKTLDEAIGGWKLGGTLTMFSGLPVTMTSPAEVDANVFPWGGQRANRYRKLTIHNRSTANWFGTDAAATPCQGTDDGACAYGIESATSYGTARPNTERAPGYRQIDLSLFKSFTTVGTQKVEFRADFFNAFNFASYGNPDSGVTDTYFGQITGTRSPQRQVQFALKYIF